MSPYKRSSSVVIFLIAALVLQCILSMRDKTAIFDEPAHLPAGYSYLVTGDFRMNKEHPPLTKMIAGLPLLFLDLKRPDEMRSWPSGDSFAFGKEFLYDSGQDADKIIFWGRMGMIATSALLGLLIFFWAAELYGVPSGLFSLFLYSFCPVIIAHSQLVTPDIGASLFSTLAVYCFWKYTRGVGRTWLWASGITLGLALLSKFNAIVLVPVYCILAYYLRRKTLPSIVLILFIAVCVIWLGYGCETGTVLNPLKEHTTARLCISGFPASFQKLLCNLGEKVRVPFPSLFQGFGILYEAKDMGRDSFLMGTYSRNGIWYGNLFAFMIKTPIPFLIFLALSFFGLARKKTAAESALLVPAAAVVLIDAFSHFSLQLKYILPVYPFLIIWMGGLVKPPILAKGTKRAFFSVLCIWYLFAALSIYPHYLAYFNEFVGGAKNGYKYLVDSNLDWGQDLKLLKKYLNENGITEARMAYFGTAKPAYYGIHYQKLEPRTPAEGWIAVSATALQGVHTYRDAFTWIRGYEPVAKIGYSIFVYHIREKEG